MIRSLGNWIEHRTGLGGILHHALYERVPGGARWRYVWGSTLAFAFFAQVVTGIILWAAYSPATTTAWGSVYQIQYQMDGGWFLRGVHHFMAQAMVVLLALHLLQVIWDGAYRAPREVNFWMGLVLMLIVLALSLTGYLLPWDQKGYWATRVATNLVGITPQVGEPMQELVVGGSNYSHATLTRFFALHAGVLPALLVVFLVIHLSLFRRHGLCAKLPLRSKDAPFWPDQVLRDAVACLAVVAVVGGLSWYFHGAELTAPADGARQYSAARPEWYFLFLFQFLKLFHGEMGEVVGALVIPGLVMAVLFAMPLIGRSKAGHYFNVGFLLFLFAGITYLTIAALQEDANDSGLQNAKWVAEQEQLIALDLAASEGIPISGARGMMREHPKSVAIRVITDQCLQCHNYQGPAGEGYNNANPTAPNLWAYGSKEWARGVLDPERVDGPDYFGHTPLGQREGGMAEFIQTQTEGGKNVAEGQEVIYTREDLDKIALALQATAGLSASSEAEAGDAIAAGNQLILKGGGCTNCHKFGESGDLGSGPDLTDWASQQWIAELVKDPNSPRHYGYLADWGEKDKQTMPAFGVETNPNGGYSDEVLEYIAQWIRGELIVEPAGH